MEVVHVIDNNLGQLTLRPVFVCLLLNSRVLPTHHLKCVYMCSVFVLIALFFLGGGVLKCFQGFRSFS